MNRFRSRSGFSLVELLVVCAVVGALAVSAYATIATSLMVSRRARDFRRGDRQRYEMVERLLQDVENAVPYSDESGRVTAFEATDREMCFITGLPDGLQRVCYYAGPWREVVGMVFWADRIKEGWGMKEAAGSGWVVVRQQRSFAHDEAAREAGRSGRDQVMAIGLADGGVRFEFLYLSGAEGTEETVWLSVWKAAVPPREIRVHVRLAGEDASGGLSRRLVIPQGQIMTVLDEGSP